MAKKKYNKSYGKDSRLFCFGCAFSKDDCGFPGRPGEQLGVFHPCMMCMRNPVVQSFLELGDPLPYTSYPDGSQPVALPIDGYISSDMLDQTEHWTERAVEHATNSQVRKDVTAIAREYGVELGGHEVDPN